MSEENADPLIALLLDSLLELEEPPAVMRQSSREGQPSRDDHETLPALRAAVLAATSEPAAANPHPFRGFARRFAAMFALSLESAEQILARAAAPVTKEWQRLRTMNVFHFPPGERLRGAHAGLVRVLPGTTFPSHTHLGTETTLFLAGMARDDDSGKLHLPGDIVTLGPQSVHHATALPPHECIFAVLFEGGTLHFHGHDTPNDPASDPQNKHDPRHS